MAKPASPTVPSADKAHIERPVQGRYFSLGKTVSWRLIGSTDTFVIAWLVSGAVAKAGIVAIAEFLTKPVLFYLHERLWLRTGFGLYAHNASASSDDVAILTGERRTRSLCKAVSWRITATIDTTVISVIVTGSLPVALAIGSIEMITKTVLYYYHERAWVRYGLKKQRERFQKGSPNPPDADNKALLSAQARRESESGL